MLLHCVNDMGASKKYEFASFVCDFWLLTLSVSKAMAAHLARLAAPLCQYGLARRSCGWPLGSGMEMLHTPPEGPRCGIHTHTQSWCFFSHVALLRARLRVLQAVLSTHAPVCTTSSSHGHAHSSPWPPPPLAHATRSRCHRRVHGSAEFCWRVSRAIKRGISCCARR